jgi:hypothetical protein
MRRTLFEERRQQRYVHALFGVPQANLSSQSTGSYDHDATDPTERK